MSLGRRHRCVGDARVDLALFVQPQPALAVLVLGLAMEPVLLPGSASLPCVLVPRLDVLSLLLPQQSFAFHLALPPSVRPLDLHAQVVAIDEIGSLATSDAYLFHAL